MGVVVLQIGQGGNQMGCALFQCLASMCASTPMEFFRSSPRTSALVARSILVDMEPKVPISFELTCFVHKYLAFRELLILLSS